MSKKSNSTKVHVSDREFIRVNLELKNGSILDIATRLGLKPATVSQRRNKINHIARVLPSLRRGKQKKFVDYVAIAAEVQEELNQQTS